MSPLASLRRTRHQPRLTPCAGVFALSRDIRNAALSGVIAGALPFPLHPHSEHWALSVGPVRLI